MLWVRTYKDLGVESSYPSGYPIQQGLVGKQISLVKGSSGNDDNAIGYDSDGKGYTSRTNSTTIVLGVEIDGATATVTQTATGFTIANDSTDLTVLIIA